MLGFNCSEEGIELGSSGSRLVWLRSSDACLHKALPFYLGVRGGRFPGAFLPESWRRLALTGCLCRRPRAEAVAPFPILFLSQLFQQLSCPLLLLPATASLRNWLVLPASVPLCVSPSPEVLGGVSLFLEDARASSRPLSALHQPVLCCFICVPLVLRLSVASAVLHTMPDTSVLLRENGLVQEGAMGLKARGGTPSMSNAHSGWGTSQ